MSKTSIQSLNMNCIGDIVRRRTSILLAGVLLAAHFISGCGTSDPESVSSNNQSGGTANSTGQTQTTVLNADPLVVTVSKDTTRTVNVKIEADKGGAINATGADGTVYSLKIPPNALAGTETISITPVSSISGLPLSGGFLGAVHLEPEGLRLLEPATLTITLPQPVPTAGPTQATSYGYVGEGSELYLYPSTIDGKTITMNINHFSGYGGSAGTDGERKVVAGKSPSSSENQTAQQIYDILKSAKDSGKSPDDPEVVKALKDVFKKWFDTTIQPQLKAAEANDDLVHCAIAEFLTWLKQLTLLTLDRQFVKETENGMVSAAKALKNAFDQSYKRCVENNDPFESNVMLAFAKEALLLNGLGNIDISKQLKNLLDFEAVLGKAKKCMTFEVTFDSTFEYNSGVTDYIATNAFVTTTPAIASFDPASLMISSPDVAARMSSTYKEATENAYSGIFAVWKMVVEGGPKHSFTCGGRNKPSSPPPFDIKMAFRADYPNLESIGWSDLSNVWVSTYDLHHSDQLLDGDKNVWRAEGFRRGEGVIFAEKFYNKVYINDGPGSKELEKTLITVKHKPQ